MTSYMTFLMHKTAAGQWEKLTDIKDFPDMDDAPEQLDNTTLSNKGRVYEEGIQETSSKEFTAPYDEDEYDELCALKGKVETYGLWLGGTESDGEVTPTGDRGKWTITGKLRVSLIGKGVNEVLDMKITITPTQDIVKQAKGS